MTQKTISKRWFWLALVAGMTGCGAVEAAIQDIVDTINAGLQEQLSPEEIAFQIPAEAEAIGISAELQEVDAFFLGKRTLRFAPAQEDGDTPISSDAVTSITNAVTAALEQTASTNIVSIDVEGKVEPAGNAFAEVVYVGGQGAMFLVRFDGEGSMIENELGEVVDCDPQTMFCPCASGDYVCFGDNSEFVVVYYVPHDGSAGAKFQLSANRDNAESTGDPAWSDFSDGFVVGETLDGDIVFRNADIFRVATKTLEPLNTSVESPTFTHMSGNFVQVGDPNSGQDQSASFVLDTETGERTFTEILIAALDEQVFITGGNDNLAALHMYAFGGDGLGSAITRTVTSSALFITGESEGTEFTSTLTLEVTVGLYGEEVLQDGGIVAVTDGAVVLSGYCAATQPVIDAALVFAGNAPYDNAAAKCENNTFPARCEINICNGNPVEVGCPDPHVCLIRADGSTQRLVEEPGEGELIVSGDYYLTRTLTSLKFAERGDAAFTTIFDNDVTVTQMTLAGSKVFYVGEDNFGVAQTGVYDMALKAGQSIDTEIALQEIFGISR